MVFKISVTGMVVAAGRGIGAAILPTVLFITPQDFSDMKGRGKKELVLIKENSFSSKKSCNSLSESVSACLPAGR